MTRDRQVPPDVLDGIADLRDYCVDPDTNVTTPVAGEALSGLYRLYQMGEPARACQAYVALHRLRTRNSDTFGDDIPVNHVPVYKGFRDLVDTLIYFLERDHDRDLKRHGMAVCP